jgi:hypothetical protein
MNLKTFDSLFRPALLVLIFAGLIVATWHVAWLHKHTGDRYELQVSERAIHVLDRQERVVYSTSAFFNKEASTWTASPLPKQP